MNLELFEKQINEKNIPSNFFSIHNKLKNYKEKYEYEWKIGSNEYVLDGIIEHMLTIFRKETERFDECDLDFLLDFLFIKDKFVYSEYLLDQSDLRQIIRNRNFFNKDELIEIDLNTEYTEKFKNLFWDSRDKLKPFYFEYVEEERKRKNAESEAYRMRYEL